MAKEGKSKEEILKMLDFYVHILNTIYCGRSGYLFRGGRVTRAQAL